MSEEWPASSFVCSTTCYWSNITITTASSAASLLDCEQSLFGQSRLSSAGLERANSRERGKRECEASESRGEAGEKAGKEGGTAFSFEPDVFR